MLAQGIPMHAREETSGDLITHLHFDTDPMLVYALFSGLVVDPDQHIGLFGTMINCSSGRTVINLPSTGLGNIMVIICIIPQDINIQKTGMVIGSNVQASNIVIFREREHIREKIIPGRSAVAFKLTAAFTGNVHANTHICTTIIQNGNTTKGDHGPVSISTSGTLFKRDRFQPKKGDKRAGTVAF